MGGRQEWWQEDVQLCAAGGGSHFMQCFLRRDLDTDNEPITYQVLVNNIWVKPGGAIITVALQKSAAMLEQEFSETASQVVKESYVDDPMSHRNNNQEVGVLQGQQVLNGGKWPGQHTAHRGEGARAVVGHPLGSQDRQLQVPSLHQPLPAKDEIKNWSWSLEGTGSEGGILAWSRECVISAPRSIYLTFSMKYRHILGNNYICLVNLNFLKKYWGLSHEYVRWNCFPLLLYSTLQPINLQTKKASWS